MANKFDADEIAHLMRESREISHRLFDLVIAESDLRRPPAEGYRPILWHLGHLGAFEGYWILQRVKGDPAISSRYDAIFDPIKTPKEDASNLPPIAEIESYIARVREETLGFLATASPDSNDPMLRDFYVFNLVIEHEYQHQETLAYLLQMLDPQSKRRPDAARRARDADGRHIAPASRDLPAAATGPARGDMARIEGGSFEIGSRGYPFAYDNEQPPHTVELADFRIDRYPVTNGEFAEFVEAGGYKIRSLWSDEGWDWKENQKVEHPLYWSLPGGGLGDDSTAGGWRVREMFEYTGLRLDHPVSGVSWHEASAYARFVGKRLPTEAEWEKAASWDPRARSKRRFSWGDEPARIELANYDGDQWGTTAVASHLRGQSAYGCIDMTGNVWEWTASVFDGYPGFEAFPYSEYSELWFDKDHRVLKGGSWATRMPLLRCSFRNFWRPGFRIAFAGFRCAAD
ncbi:MAG TPA: SUMF1/EgtB/PvdO family nonheme iron enzyme [Blastocatellia bacterium]